MEKNLQLKKFNYFWIKNCNLTIPRLLKRISKLQKKPSGFSPQKRTSSTSKHEISEFILFLWVIFAHLDPDLDLDSESGFSDLTESGSETLGTSVRKLVRHS
jgi:hypothetical protein